MPSPVPKNIFLGTSLPIEMPPFPERVVASPAFRNTILGAGDGLVPENDAHLQGWVMVHPLLKCGSNSTVTALHL
jgi:hypothetical protein